MKVRYNFQSSGLKVCYLEKKKKKENGKKVVKQREEGQN